MPTGTLETSLIIAPEISPFYFSAEYVIYWVNVFIPHRRTNSAKGSQKTKTKENMSHEFPKAISKF